MKKYLPYIGIALALVVALSLYLTNKTTESRKLDERFSFNKRDKIPYGLYVAYNGLKEIFPQASVTSERNAPGLWDSLSTYQKGQALVVVSPFFNADDFEMRKLVRFIENGNHVFVSTIKASYYVEKYLSCDIAYYGNINNVLYNSLLMKDTLSVSLIAPAVKDSVSYTYPGKRLDFSFAGIDEDKTIVLGDNGKGEPNFIQLRIGEGSFNLHLAPMALTNYFLLHKNNIAYYEQVMSSLPSTITKIVWDEYFIRKRPPEESDNNKKNWLSVFMQNESLRWALLTAILALLIYVLIEMKRKQRPIPIINPPKNDSLDFVKTIGRLYYDKGDHKNLARKMSAYFLEHIRNRYKLSTTTLDDDFCKRLQYKTGITEEEINRIIQTIHQIENQTAISDEMLAEFHKQLESFYQKA